MVETVFTPFRVSDGDIRAQQEALDAGQVQRDSRLLIMEQGAGRLALV